MHLCSSWYSYHSCCLLALSKVSLFVKAGATDLSSALRRAFIHFKSDAAETAFLCPEKKIFIHIWWLVVFLFVCFLFFFSLKSIFTEMCISLGFLWGPFTLGLFPAKVFGGKQQISPLSRSAALPTPPGATRSIALKGISATPGWKARTVFFLIQDLLSGKISLDLSP